jgi:hypothetical protein
MSMPAVSVVINNFEYEQYVGHAIESALTQRPRPEVVVVDDGSSDGSRAVISSFGRRVKTVFQENSGQAAAFNSGFAAATGDVIVFLDADDMLTPGAVRAIRETFVDSAVAKLHWPLWEIDAVGRPTGGLRPEALMPEGDLHDRVAELGPLAHSNPPTSGNAFSRRVLERILPMPVEEYRLCADAYLVMLASIYGPVRRSLVPLSLWRRHGENRFNGTRETVSERVAADLERYDALAASLAVHLDAQGGRVDPLVWRRRNVGYRRLERIRSTLDAIERFVPPGAGLVLVDDGDWSQGHLENRELLRDRRTFRLFDGVALAQPPAESAVLAEVRRLRRAGATHIVFIWPGAWWLQQYPSLERYLRTRGRAVPGDILAFEFPRPGRAARDAERPAASLPRSASLGERRRALQRLETRIGELRTSIGALERELAGRADADSAVPRRRSDRRTKAPRGRRGAR